MQVPVFIHAWTGRISRVDCVECGRVSDKPDLYVNGGQDFEDYNDLCVSLEFAEVSCPHDRPISYLFDTLGALIGC